MTRVETDPNTPAQVLLFISIQINLEPLIKMENDQVRKPYVTPGTDQTWKDLSDSMGVMGKERFIVEFGPGNGFATRQYTHQA